MKLIERNNLRILQAEEGYMLKDKNDVGETLEDGTVVEPHLSEVIYLARQIETLEQAQELYEEVAIKD